jgi:hypothetical protein
MSDFIRLAECPLFYNQSLFYRVSRKRPNAFITVDSIVRKPNPSFSTSLLRKTNIIATLDIIGDKIWLVRVNDWIYVIQLEKKVTLLHESSVNFLLRGATVIGCCIITGV